jgi:hypothetical protein
MNVAGVQHQPWAQVDSSPSVVLANGFGTASGGTYMQGQYALVYVPPQQQQQTGFQVTSLSMQGPGIVTASGAQGSAMPWDGNQQLQLQHGVLQGQQGMPQLQHSMPQHSVAQHGQHTLPVVQHGVLQGQHVMFTPAGNMAPGGHSVAVGSQQTFSFAADSACSAPMFTVQDQQQQQQQGWLQQQPMGQIWGGGAGVVGQGNVFATSLGGDVMLVQQQQQPSDPASPVLGQTTVGHSTVLQGGLVNMPLLQSSTQVQ